MRIVLIAGEPAFRFGFRVVVDAAADLDLVGDADDARSGFAAIDAERPDLVVIDVALRGMSGIDATREIKRRAPKARVLLLASWPRERDVLDGLSAGADGFALKTDPVEVLLEAIRTVGAGQRYLTSQVRGLDLPAPRGVSPEGKGRDVLHALSLREREVLGLVIKGYRSRDIARELCISIKTVETHRNHINRKLGCASAADLTRFAADNGLLRSAPSLGLGQQDRTFVVIMDDDPDWRDNFLREVAAQGYQCGRASSAASALAELRAAAHPSLMMIDEDTHPIVRAVASLPSTDVGHRLVAALERPPVAANVAANGRSTRLV
jgi:DNA-binding NarL/FixJ family response regulator